MQILFYDAFSFAWFFFFKQTFLLTCCPLWIYTFPLSLNKNSKKQSDQYTSAKKEIKSYHHCYQLQGAIYHFCSSSVSCSNSMQLEQKQLGSWPQKEEDNVLLMEFIQPWRWNACKVRSREAEALCSCSWNPTLILKLIFLKWKQFSTLRLLKDPPPSQRSAEEHLLFMCTNVQSLAQN